MDNKQIIINNNRIKEIDNYYNKKINNLLNEEKNKSKMLLLQVKTV
jgi:hypothetical protein